MATVTAPAAESRAAASSRRSLIPGRQNRFSRSCETEAEITSSSPAAVESAAARPPAAVSPTTQAGSRAISGLASTMMSRSMTNSAPGPSEYWMSPSPFRSVNEISPVVSQLRNQSGASAIGVPWSVWIRFTRAKAATAGAAV